MFIKTGSHSVRVLFVDFPKQSRPFRIPSATWKLGVYCGQLPIFGFVSLKEGD
jgi:hypothetical protein